ncbi:hypothetical protein [Fluviispira vulneris]|uniref:hypothetical protein n=1 Tax=Fluviispira vulneris TaxID=2763012 RepID=UPI00164971E1|nr:hypothetical protein [Fluviispira vulneris]
MKKNEIILIAALNGITLACFAEGSNSNPAHVTQEVEKCFGINKCKGLTSCSVEKDDIEAVKKAFGKKFAKTQPYECAGNIGGAAKKGFLGWIYVARGSCHKIEGGFLIVKDQSGKKTVDKG